MNRSSRHLLSLSDRRAFRRQRILITGAAGFVGSLLARRLAVYRPAQLTLMDQSDTGLARLERDLLQLRSGLRLNVALGDVTRPADVREIARTARPDVIYHMAAFSHVGTAERAICAAIRTNVFGTVHVTREAAAAGARLLVVSTRDAADVTTIVGATRRLSELVSLRLAASGLRPVIVRLDDVLENPTGPVDVLLHRLAAGEPLTEIRSDITHVLMTAEEAVSLILKADLVGGSWETYRLDTGAPIRLADIAQRLLSWAAEGGIRRVRVRVTGPASSERAEVALRPGLTFRPSEHPHMFVAEQRAADSAALARILRALREDVRRGDALTALADLRAAVPGFVPSRAVSEKAAAATLGGTLFTPGLAERELST